MLVFLARDVDHCLGSVLENLILHSKRNLADPAGDHGDAPSLLIGGRQLVRTDDRALHWTLGQVQSAIAALEKYFCVIMRMVSGDFLCTS